MGCGRVGLTSPRHREFVDRLGLYDQVLSYEQTAALPRSPAVLVDVAGNPAHRERVGRRLGPMLVRTVIVGSTHRDASGVDDRGFLFVPDLLAERARQDGWQRLNARYSSALRGFATRSIGWLRVDHASGAVGVETAYRQALDNTTPAGRAHVLTLADTAGSGRDQGEHSAWLR